MIAYPEHLVSHRFLFDGTPVTIRPIRPDDAGMEQAFVAHLSATSRYYRFMEKLNELSPAKTKYFTDIDYDRHMAFVATVAADGAELEIGVARYITNPDGKSCEFAIVIDDAWQRSGVAGLLMAALMAAARARGLQTIEGMVMSGNDKMLKFARQLGFAAHRDADDWQTVVVSRPL